MSDEYPELERYIIFMLDDTSEVEEILAEYTGVPFDVKFVYDRKIAEECGVYAKSSYRYLTYYLVYDNKWLDGEAFLQLVCMRTREMYRSRIDI